MELRRRVREEDKRWDGTRERGGETERTCGERGYVIASPISRDDGERNNPTVTVNMRHCEGNEKRGVVYGVISSLFLSVSPSCMCITPGRKWLLNMDESSE